MEAAARVQPASAGPVYTRRQPETTALYRVLQQHLLTFEQQWTDAASGRTLPKFVTEELHKYLDCGILGRGFAHCGEHHVGKLHPARPPPQKAGGGDDWVN